VPVDNEETFEHFCVHGWMRVRAAFSVDEAAAMRAAAWRALDKVGIRRNDPSTWTTERPEHLQDVRDQPPFRAVGSTRLLEAIAAALEGQAYETPRNWGALFLAFQHGLQFGQGLAAAGKVSAAVGVGVPFFLFTGFAVWMFAGSRKRPGETPIGRFVGHVGDIIDRLRKRMKPRRRIRA